MREALKEYDGNRATFSAKVQQFGYSTPGNTRYRTACLVDVKDLATHEIVAKHVWVNKDKLPSSKRLAINDIITFTAEAKPYQQRRFDGKEFYDIVNYGLCHIQKIRIIKRRKRLRQKPKHRGRPSYA